MEAKEALEPPRENNKILGVHLGHQETERVVQGIDILFEFLPPEQWMAENVIAELLCKDLGYEDIDEFEDAIQGEFKAFLACMPHIETREPTEDEKEGGLRFRIKALPPIEERVHTKLVYKITSSEDLWRVCLKSPTARAFIPELEFEIGPTCTYNTHTHTHNHVISS